MRLFELAKKYELDRAQFLAAVQAADFHVNDLAEVTPEIMIWFDVQKEKGFPGIDSAIEARTAAPKKQLKRIPPRQTKKEPAPAPQASPPPPPPVIEPVIEEKAESEVDPDVQPSANTEVSTPKKLRIPAAVAAKNRIPVKRTASSDQSGLPQENETTGNEAPADHIAAADTVSSTAKDVKTGVVEPIKTDMKKFAKYNPAKILEEAKKDEKKKKEKEKVKNAETPPKQFAAPIASAPIDPDSVIVTGSSTGSVTGTKHKRADFKPVRKKVELPSMFLSQEAEQIRSIRGSSRSGSRQRRSEGGKRKGGQNRAASSGERDPNMVAQLMPKMTLRELSEAIGVKMNQIQAFILKNNKMLTANDVVDDDDIQIIAAEFQVKFEWESPQSIEEQIKSSIELHAKKSFAGTETVRRPPVVTFMGHVDHGKTSLLDRIRQSRVADGESGGITQHIGAYSVVKNDHPITFLDTPGHELFTAMRARGAKLTDIVVLVVAADDGLMQQTEEAYNHAKAANCPVIVAINKCDLNSANPERVRSDLANRLGLLPEEWGGTVGMINVSAVTGAGVEELLDRILLEAEMLELSANPDRPALGHIVEARMTEHRGVVATVLIKDGTLRRGDVVLSSTAYGKIKLMFDHHSKTTDSVKPGYAASISGLSTVPEPGERIYVMEDIQAARELAEKRIHELAVQARRQHVTMSNLMEHLAGQSVRELKIVLKADVQGSLEVISKMLGQMGNEEVKITIIHAAVGGINQADVILADASDAIIVGFNIPSDSAARLQAEAHGVQIKVYHVIYRLEEDIKAALSGMLAPEEREKVHGHLEVRQVFFASRIGNIAGCYVTDGIVTRQSKIRVFRNNVKVFEGVLENLKRFKDDVREVRAGFECGLTIHNYDDIKAGDILEAYAIESVSRTLD